MAWAVAVDVGGTFTDLVAFDSTTGDLRFAKAHTTPRELADGVLEALSKSGILPNEVRYLRHGTTQAINTVIEKTGAKTGLLTTKGFRDVLELARGNRPEAFNLFYRRQEALVPRELRFEVNERIDAQGTVLSPLTDKEMERVKEELERAGAQAVAICFLHSYRNPRHEQDLAQYLRSRLSIYVSASHELSREWREYERTSTAVVNAYVGPRMGSYLSHLDTRLRQAGFAGTLLVMESNGGVLSLESAVSKPVFLMESGPVAGVVGASRVASLFGYKNAIAFDMGGTTAKCSFIYEGNPAVTAGYYIGGYERGYPLQVSVIDIIEVGAGGGSIAWFDDADSLHVGPRSAGAEPGPVAYGRGGVEPTVTDANVSLGRLGVDRFLGGEQKLDRDSAARAIQERVASRVGLNLDQTANGIIRLTNVTMASAIRKVSVERGYDPRECVLIAYGGAGPLHAASLARELAIPLVVVPQQPGHFSAWGMLLTDIRHDYVQTYTGRLDTLSLAELEAVYMRLRRQAEQEMASQSAHISAIHYVRYADMRYVGQEHTVQVPVPEQLEGEPHRVTLRNSFDRVYDHRYGHSEPTALAEIVGCRLVADGLVGKPDFKASVLSERREATPRSTRQVFFDDHGQIDCGVFWRPDLIPGNVIRGPAVIEEVASTILVNPGDIATLNEYGYLLIQIGKNSPRPTAENTGLNHDQRMKVGAQL